MAMHSITSTDLCFWHPVGSHAGESLDEILIRKRKDIKRFGFTLWSFAPARPERVFAWRNELWRLGQEQCVAVCCGDSTTDPYTGLAPVTWGTEDSDDLDSWTPMPCPRMTSYHRGPRKNGLVASAFIITSIEVPPSERVERPRQWFRAQHGCWEEESTVPTRGEYLIRKPTATERGPLVQAVLTVQRPFVVWVR